MIRVSQEREGDEPRPDPVATVQVDLFRPMLGECVATQRVIPGCESVKPLRRAKPIEDDSPGLYDRLQPCGRCGQATCPGCWGRWDETH